MMMAATSGRIRILILRAGDPFGTSMDSAIERTEALEELLEWNRMFYLANTDLK